ncbi:MAG TPA: hypothetical protein VGG85_03495 [Terracidiphilus sp.]|jgi:hypothetical protein
MFMWGFGFTFALYAATGSTRLLMYGCIVATAMVLLLRRWIAEDTAKPVVQ